MSELHTTHTYPALMPLYVSRFKCIGPECEDNCCTGWKVTLDKKTFYAYRQVTLPQLTERFAQQIKRERSQGSEASYGSIKLLPNTRQCPFMEDRLCAIQRELGEDYLSATCSSFPRHTRNFSGQYEQALTLSCPEAARLALLADDAFDFVQSSVTVRAETISSIKPMHGLSLERMNEVRVFCMQLMRSEGLELWQRLAVLGVFCEGLTTLLAGGGQAGVSSLIENTRVMLEKGLVLDTLAGMTPDHATQAQIFARLWRTRSENAVSELQSKVQMAIVKGLGADPESGWVSNEKLAESYVSGLVRLAEALLSAPHVLENYVLNEMFREFFPFGDTTPYQHYLRLVTRFGLVRLMMAGLCNNEGPLPDAVTLVQVVQTFCRRYQHNVQFMAQVNNALKNSGWDKLEKIYRFLPA